MEVADKTKKWLKIGGIIFIILAIFSVGFFIGRGHTKIVEKEVIKYVDLPAVHDTIPKPFPVKEKIDTGKLIKQIIDAGLFSELFPKKKDTVYLTPKDSSLIIKDWSKQREYTTTLFDSDTLGKFTLNTSVQFNRLGDLEYTFKPKQKTVTEYVEVKKKYIPFIGAGISTFPSAGIEAGLFINQSWGFALSGNYYFYTGTEYQPNVVVSLNGGNGTNGLSMTKIYLPKWDVGLKVVKMF